MYWLIGPGSASLTQGCCCAFPLQEAWGYCGGLLHSLFTLQGRTRQNRRAVDGYCCRHFYLPVYITDMYVSRDFICHLWCQTPRSAAPPLQWCCHLELLCVVFSMDNISRGVMDGAPLRSVFVVLLPKPSLKSASSLVSPIWAYIIVAWWPEGSASKKFHTAMYKL